jgi:predicted nucleic acid-binding protein
MTRVFYDSYAVLAYISGEEHFAKYFDKSSGALTKLNLMEIYFRTAKLHGHKSARQIIDRFSRYLIDFDTEDIAGSMKLREELMKKGMDISYADALGYFLSKKHKIRFLTGDLHFEKLDNVEYVK